MINANRKANSSLQKMLFLIGYLIIGAVLLFVIFSIFSETSDGSAQSKIASDLALTIQSLALYEGDIFIIYSPDIESFSAEISSFEKEISPVFTTQGARIFTFGPDGEATADAILPKSISVKEGSWNQVSTLPIQKRGSVISFTQPSFDELTGFCNKLPGSLQKGVDIDEGNANERLEAFELALSSRLNSDANSQGTDLTIKVNFKEDEDIIIEHGSGLSEKLGCFLEANFREESKDNEIYSNISRIRSTGDNYLILTMNDDEYFQQGRNQEYLLNIIQESVDEVKR